MDGQWCLVNILEATLLLIETLATGTPVTGEEQLKKWIIRLC